MENFDRSRLVIFVRNLLWRMKVVLMTTINHISQNPKWESEQPQKKRPTTTDNNVQRDNWVSHAGLVAQ
jgi:hypothetical protein